MALQSVCAWRDAACHAMFTPLVQWGISASQPQQGTHSCIGFSLPLPLLKARALHAGTRAAIDLTPYCFLCRVGWRNLSQLSCSYSLRTVKGSIGDVQVGCHPRFEEQVVSQPVYAYMDGFITVYVREVVALVQGLHNNKPAPALLQLAMWASPSGS